MALKTFQIGCILSVCIILIAIWLRPVTDWETNSQLRAILRGLTNLEVPSRTRKPNVAVGYGACMDVFTNARDILEFRETESYPEKITDFSDLVQVYTYFFRHGAAAERFIQNSSLFNALVERAEQTTGARWEIGGNAAVMANRFHHEGCNVLLAAKMTPGLQKTLPNGIRGKQFVVTGPETFLYLSNGVA